MSNLALPNDDYPEAASKNLSDAVALSKAQRHDGCGYLAGYVIECSLKTIIIVGEISKSTQLGPNTTLSQFLGTSSPSLSQSLTQAGDRVRGFKHNLQNLSREAQNLAAQANSATAKYASSLQSKATLRGWSESIRYRPQGKVSETQSKDWLAAAQDIYTSSIVQMRLDGLIKT